jgi:hypothetical protein
MADIGDLRLVDRPAPCRSLTRSDWRPGWNSSQPDDLVEAACPGNPPSGDRRRDNGLGIRPLVAILPDRTRPTLLENQCRRRKPATPNQQRPRRAVPLRQVRPPKHDSPVVDVTMRLLSPEPVDEMATQARKSSAAPQRTANLRCRA